MNRSSSISRECIPSVFWSYRRRPEVYRAIGRYLRGRMFVRRIRRKRCDL